MQGSSTTLNADPFYSHDSQYTSGYPPHVGYELEDEVKQPLSKPSSYNLPMMPKEYPQLPYADSRRTSELGPEDSASQVAWAKRQEGPKRGPTRKVKLTRGNWVVDHRVPTAVKNSIEPKWSQGEGYPSDEKNFI
jgi:chitin synthase